MATSCSNCGNIPRNDARFCDQCGTKFESSPADEKQHSAGILCRACGTVNSQDNNFCEQCGTSLQHAEPAPQAESASAVPSESSLAPGGTVELSKEILDAAKFDMSQGGEGKSLMALEFSGGGQLVLSGKKTYNVGRKDAKIDWHPEVDLGARGGKDEGVSRRHARIVVEDGTAFAEDLGSLNGTYINSLRLEVRRRYPLQHGDMLRFGSFLAVFRRL